MTPLAKPDASALAGTLLFASIALGAGLVDHGQVPASAPAQTGSVVGVVDGASRYRVILTPARSPGSQATDHVIEGWGRSFRGDGIAAGRYRISVIVEPDGDQPWLVVPVPLPADAVEIPRRSSEFERLDRFASEFARASSTGRADDIAPFFAEEFRGPSGQSRAEHLEQARAGKEAADTLRFTVNPKSAYRSGDRWFAELSYQGTYRVNRNGDVRSAGGLFLSELREDGDRFRFLTTESIAMPSLGGIEALPRRILTAPDFGTIVVRSGATTVLPRPIDASAAERPALDATR